MTDLEKWQRFLSEMEIPFLIDTEWDDWDGLYIGCTGNGVADNYDSIFDTIAVYDPAITIVFNKDGSFDKFYPTGEDQIYIPDDDEIE